MSATSFTEGGHISNVNAGVGNIDSISANGARGNDLSIGQGDNANVNAAPTPSLLAGSIKIPLSAYVNENINDGFVSHMQNLVDDKLNTGATLNGYEIVRWSDGRDYLTPNDPTAPSAFQHKDGWYVSNDGKLAIGQDDAKDLAVTSTAKASNYPDDGSVAKIVNPNPSLKVFGSDNADKITVDGAQIASVRGGVGNDNVDLKDGAKVFGVSGGSGSDNITVEGGSKVDTLLGDNKTKNDVHEKAYQASQGKNIDIEDSGAAGDTIKVSGTGTQVRLIGAGNGDDNITVEKGAKVNHIRADEGNDRVTVSDSGTYVSVINGRGGDDTILVEKGAKVDGIAGRWGNDKITVKDAGTVISEDIEGNEDSDTIKILDGAKVKGYVSGGRGESPSIYGGAEKSDNDNITVENATVDGEVEGSMRSNYSGDDGMKFTNSQIGGRKISGGYGENKIEITDGMNLESKWIEGNKFNDEITVNGDAKLKNTYIQGEAGDDTITIKDNAKVKGGNINTGAGANDKININGNAELDGTTLQFEGGKSTDKATLNVTGNAVLKDVSIQASSSLGEQYMNFHQSGEAKIHTITGSNNKDVMDITGNFTVSNKITGNGGDDEINIHGGATAKIKQADMGDGNDKLTVENATLKDSFVNMDGGNDEININAGANLTNTRIYTGEGNNTVNVRGGTFSKAEIGLDKGKNEVNIESGAVFGDQDAGLNAFGHHKTYIRSDHRDDYSSEDTINVKAGATVKNAEIQTYGGKDTINVDGSIINSNVDMGKGNDEININSGANLTKAKINTGEGDDTVSIGKNASIDDSSTIDGGDGNDTLKIADGSIDFSRVKNFEKLDLTNGERTEITLRASDVFNMTDSRNKLTIDGDGNDKLNLSGFNQSTARAVGSEYTEYTSTDGTVTIEIKNDITITF